MSKWQGPCACGKTLYLFRMVDRLSEALYHGENREHVMYIDDTDRRESLDTLIVNDWLERVHDYERITVNDGR